MPGICCGQNSQFQHVWNWLQSNLSVSGCLEFVVVKIVSFSMSANCCGQNSEFQLVWHLLWSKWSDSAWHGSFRLSGVQNREFQHIWNLSWSKIVSFSMSGNCRDQNSQFQHVWN
jgi:hypothetical protein